jgi:hypothetical protein
MQLIEDRYLPWLTSLRRAAIATTNGDKEAAIAILNEVPDRKFGGRWRGSLSNWFVLEPLHEEPEYKRLIAALEQDMERYREEAYELLGIVK